MVDIHSHTQIDTADTIAFRITYILGGKGIPLNFPHTLDFVLKRKIFHCFNSIVNDLQEIFLHVEVHLGHNGY